MSRVVAMFSASRNMVETRSMVGKAENSSGFSIHSETSRISTDKAIENASPRSMMKAGTGRKKMQRMPMTPRAKAISRPPLAAGCREVIAAACAMVHLIVSVTQRWSRKLASNCRSIALLDAAIDLFGKGMNLRADERAAQRQHHQ